MPYSLSKYFAVARTGSNIWSVGNSSSGSSTMYLFAANSAFHTTSTTRTSYSSDSVCEFWTICCRWLSASAGSSTRVTSWSGFSLFHSSRTSCTNPEVSLPWTRVIGPVPSRATEVSVSPSLSPPPQAARTPTSVEIATAVVIGSSQSATPDAYPIVTFSSISVTSAAIGERSERVSVTCANRG